MLFRVGVFRGRGGSVASYASRVSFFDTVSYALVSRMKMRSIVDRKAPSFFPKKRSG